MKSGGGGEEKTTKIYAFGWGRRAVGFFCVSSSQLPKGMDALAPICDDVMVEVALFLSPTDLVRLYHTAKRFGSKKFVATVARKSGVFVGHKEGINNLILVPSSTGETKFVTGAADGTVRVWNLQTMETETIIRMAFSELFRSESNARRHHFHPTRALAAMPDGKRCLVSMSRDNLVRVCNLEDGTTERTFEHGKEIFTFALAPDGKTYACNSYSLLDGFFQVNVVQICHTETGEILRTLVDLTDREYAMEFTPDGKSLVVVSHRQRTVVDVESGESRHLPNMGVWYREIAMAGDGTTCVSVGKQLNVAVWNRETLKEQAWMIHEHYVYTIDISDDGKFVLTGSVDNKVRLWCAITGDLVKTFEGHTDLVSVVRFLPGGKKCLSASFDETVRVWDLDLDLEKES